MKTTLTRSRLLWSLGSMVLLATAPPAVAADRLPLKIAPDAPRSLALAGESTLHPYTSASSTFELKGELQGEDLGTTLTADALEKGKVTSLEVTVQATSLKSGKADLDKMLHKTLKADAFPIIRFTMKDTRATRKAGDSFTVKSRGTLTVAGVSREVELNAQVTVSGGRLLLVGGTDLKMSDFGIQPPSFLFGAMKTADAIRISFSVPLASPLVAVR